RHRTVVTTAAASCTTRQRGGDLQWIAHVVAGAVPRARLYVGPGLGAGFASAMQWFVWRSAPASRCGNGRGPAPCFTTEDGDDGALATGPHGVAGLSGESSEPADGAVPAGAHRTARDRARAVRPTPCAVRDR